MSAISSRTAARVCRALRRSSRSSWMRRPSRSERLRSWRCARCISARRSSSRSTLARASNRTRGCGEPSATASRRDRRPDVMPVHLVGHLGIGADDHEAESRFVLAQRRFHLTGAQRRVAARHARHGAAQPGPLDGGQGGAQQRLRDQEGQPHHQRERHRQQDERDERGGHRPGEMYGNVPTADKGRSVESTRCRAPGRSDRALRARRATRRRARPARPRRTASDTRAGAPSCAGSRTRPRCHGPS